MNSEIRIGETETIEYQNIINTIPTLITTAMIRIVNSKGTEIVASIAMTLSGSPVNYIASYDWNTTGQEAGRNFRAEMTIDGKIYNRLIDLVKYPFINEVIEADLLAENDEIKKAGSELSGRATGGSVNTLIDLDRAEAAGYFTGGALVVYPLDNADQIEKRKVLSNDPVTGTITFEPDIILPVTEEKYTIRASWNSDIIRAGEVVQTDLWKIKKRAYLIIDNTQVSNMIIYKFFERFYAKRRKTTEDNDTAHISYTYYKGLYDGELNGLPLAYDENEDGEIDGENEEYSKGSINLNR